MSNEKIVIQERSLGALLRRIINGIRFSIANQLILSYLLIILTTSVVFSVIGIQIISNQITADAQEKVRNDIDTAREIYLDNLDQINDAVLATANSPVLVNAIVSGDLNQANNELIGIKLRESLDILTIADTSGDVLIRTSNFEQTGDNINNDALVRYVMDNRSPIAATTSATAVDLLKESPLLAEKTCPGISDAPESTVFEEGNETDGMLLEAVAPIYDSQNNFVGVILGGVLLNRNFAFVDKISRTLFHNLRYKGKDIGVVRIYLGDVGISSCVVEEAQEFGSHVSADVYSEVIEGGGRWVGRNYILNSWYITAYEPIKDHNFNTIGILNVGELEQKFFDTRSQLINTFIVITIIVTITTGLLSYFIARRIAVPIRKLVTATRDVAYGDFDAQVMIRSNDELGVLADTFNVMASALKERDEKLKEFAKSKIMESERLALIGQLSANVAHELNNPLTGIVTYSHLLMEKLPQENSTRDSIQKIVTQANRCKDIIRGLLDFSRQRMPNKALCDINSILQNCISLVEYQALFHNIEIKKELDAKLPLAVIDPDQMERVFVNIIINAAEAMEGSGCLKLSTSHDPVKDFVQIDFVDSGQGISVENIERIFDPFFTTKEVGHGTGLGLAISYGIVKKHRGTITVKSVLGKGTTFRVLLPIKSKEQVLEDGDKAQDTHH